MKNTLILLGASIITHGIMFSGAEARLVRYEINGKQYSYSTNNHAQTAEARKRIAAAKAAEAAKAKAEAEKTQNPLTAAFGSATQKEAKEAEQQLQQTLSGPAEYMAVSQPVRNPGKKPQDEQSRRASTAKALEKTIAVVNPPAKPTRAAASTASPIIAEPIDPQRRTNVRSVSFDIQTGIKTTIMFDGVIEEEPFDSSALSFLAPEEKTSNLTAFVNQLRKIAPEEATGSIQTSVAESDDGSLIRHR
jgi:hypothetical protein